MFIIPDTVQTLAVNVAVVSATVLILKQWLRADIDRVEKNVVILEEMHDTLREDQEKALKEQTAVTNGHIAKLADTVERFVAESTKERFRKNETDAVRDKNFEGRIVGLEITTTTINKQLDRLLESVDILLRRDTA